jgi:hypothetical protein
MRTGSLFQSWNICEYSRKKIRLLSILPFQPIHPSFFPVYISIYALVNNCMNDIYCKFDKFASFKNCVVAVHSQPMPDNRSERSVCNLRLDQIKTFLTVDVGRMVCDAVWTCAHKRRFRKKYCLHLPLKVPYLPSPYGVITQNINVFTAVIRFFVTDSPLGSKHVVFYKCIL